MGFVPLILELTWSHFPFLLLKLSWILIKIFLWPVNFFVKPVPHCLSLATIFSNPGEVLFLLLIFASSSSNFSFRSESQVGTFLIEPMHLNELWTCLVLDSTSIGLTSYDCWMLVGSGWEEPDSFCGFYWSGFLLKKDSNFFWLLSIFLTDSLAPFALLGSFSS